MGNIAFVDVETDGLNPYAGNRLLEIAVIITDDDLNVLDEDGYEAVVYFPAESVRAMRGAADPFVRRMHDETGLWDRLSQPGAKSLMTVDKELLGYLSRFGKKGTMPVGGNSVRLDMNFMDKFLPMSAGHLHHQMRDVTTVAKLAQAWFPDLPEYVKHSDHTARLDIEESIRELKHYREAVFKAKFADMPQPERDEVTADVMTFLLDRGYTVIAPGGKRVSGNRTSQPREVEVTDDMVERAARAADPALWYRKKMHPMEVSQQALTASLGRARAALTAALGGGDHAE